MADRRIEIPAIKERVNSVYMGLSYGQIVADVMFLLVAEQNAQDELAIARSEMERLQAESIQFHDAIKNVVANNRKTFFDTSVDDIVKALWRWISNLREAAQKAFTK